MHEGVSESLPVEAPILEGFVEAMPLSREEGRQGQFGQGVGLCFCQERIDGVHESVSGSVEGMVDSGA
jgi:hypothetical protein